MLIRFCLFFIFFLLTAKPISVSWLDQDTVNRNESDIQKGFLFKFSVFRKSLSGDLIFGIQLSAGVSSIKGDRKNKSLPSKDCVCLWQRL